MLLEAELKKAGLLNDKQARVYLALLELGPSPVQKIARKAGVARATTYVVIDCLIKNGLISKSMQGRRPLFTAESPQQLLRLLERKQQALTSYQWDLQQLIPTLKALHNNGLHEPSVRYYPGREGLYIIRQEMTMMCSAGRDIWYNLAPSDKVKSVFGEQDLYCRGRAAKGVWSKTLFTTSSEKVKEQLLNSASAHRTERKFVAPSDMAITSGITIVRDKIAIGSFHDTVGGMVIHSPSLAQTLREFFGLIWEKLS